MAEEELSYAEILQIVELFKSSPELSEFHLKYGITELALRKPGAEGFSPQASSVATVPAAPPPQSLPSSPPKLPAGSTAVERPISVIKSEAPAGTSLKAFPIKSMTVGTFYCAPEPGATPFVSVGQRVALDTTVCIVEVMKLMNSIQANCSGVVSEILVKDGEPVEFGQTLMVIEQD